MQTAVMCHTCASAYSEGFPGGNALLSNGGGGGGGAGGVGGNVSDRLVSLQLTCRALRKPLTVSPFIMPVLAVPVSAMRSREQASSLSLPVSLCLYVSLSRSHSVQ